MILPAPHGKDGITAPDAGKDHVVKQIEKAEEPGKEGEDDFANDTHPLGGVAVPRQIDGEQRDHGTESDQNHIDNDVRSVTEPFDISLFWLSRAKNRFEEQVRIHTLGSRFLHHVVRHPCERLKDIAGGCIYKKIVEKMHFEVKRLSGDAYLPERASEGAAGYDLRAARDVVVEPQGRALVATDLTFGLPEGTYARIAPRSGLAWKHGIAIGAGVIDADYRGNVGVLMFNHSDQPVEVKKGDRIAQVILERILTPPILEVDSLSDTRRGESGFGSTGTR
jgi:dUTP pyrophosphatase